MIDIHCHVLPEVDDGALDMAEAESMLDMASSSGTTVLIATPHWNLRYRFDRARCEDLIGQLQILHGTKIRLRLGCEVHLTPEHLEAVLRRPEIYTLGASDCILVELPDAMTPAIVKPALDALLRAGLRPVIAHPERYSYIQVHHDFATELVDMGCYLQLTAQSVPGGFGYAASRTSRHLLKHRLVHLIASDGHGAVERRPLLAECFDRVVDFCGQPAADLLFVRNPGALLERKPIASMSPAPRAWIQRLAFCCELLKSQR